MPAWNCNGAATSPNCLSTGAVPDVQACALTTTCGSGSDGAAGRRTRRRLAAGGWVAIGSPMNELAMNPNASTTSSDWAAYCSSTPKPDMRATIPDASASARAIPATSARRSLASGSAATNASSSRRAA